MTYEPRTDRLGPDDTLDLPASARGVSIERHAPEEYVVHHLSLVSDQSEELDKRIQEQADRLSLREPADGEQ